MFKLNTLSWFQTVQSLLFLLNAVCFSGEATNTNLIVWHDCDSYHRRSWHGPTTPLFFNFLFTNLFSIKKNYFFIISSLFPYFNLFVSIFIQSRVNNNLHVRPYIDTNNPQGMQLGRFKNRTPARFEYIYCTLFPLCHSN